jgi:hypothetical protein
LRQLGLALALEVAVLDVERFEPAVTLVPAQRAADSELANFAAEPLTPA